MTTVIDASVALKWVLQEDGSDRARALLATQTLKAPDLLWIECANVLWAKARRGQISSPDARAALGAIEAAPVSSIATRPLALAAQTIAFELDQTAYDSLYLAAALAERATLVSADQPFVGAAGAHAMYASSVRLL